MKSSIGFFSSVHSGEGEEPMTALDAERLAQGKKNKPTIAVELILLV